MKRQNLLWAIAGVLAATSACGQGDDSGDDRDVSEVEQAVLGDNDNDGVPDLSDLDDDNDGILDQVECPAETLQGKEFWLMFNENLQGGGRRDVFVAGAPGTLVTIDANAPVAIPASGLLQTDVGIARSLAQNVVESDKAVHVVTDAGVTVFAESFEPFTVDAFTVLPVGLLGTDYYAVGYPNAIGFVSEIGVVATEDGTTVNIGADAPLSLNKGQSFMRAVVGDATGLRITSNKPIAVNTGDLCINTGAGACDHVEEMLIPIEGWASEFFVPVIPQDTDYRVVASQAGTDVFVDSVLVTTLGQGQFYSATGAGVRITTSKPTEAYLIAKGDNSGTGDPAFLLLPGRQNAVGSATFAALAADNVNTLVVSMPTAAIATLKVDGALVSPTWTAYPTGGFSYAQIEVPAGDHTVSADQAFIPVVWGEKAYESYAYVAGLQVQQAICTTDTDGDGLVDTFDLDSDGDGVNDVDEAGGTDTTPRDGHADGPIDSNGVPGTGGQTPPDTDGDGIPDTRDRDTDNDGVLDGADLDRKEPTVCRDVDADTCDDCTITGADNSGGNVNNDGLDSDGDGKCNAGDNDDDNDGVEDGTDTNPTDPNICRDVDSDSCDDCINTGANSSGGNPNNDGLDNDGDGKCDTGDLDDDNDGVPDTADADPHNPNICRDGDGDSCDDCINTGANNSGGDVNNDGPDRDGDGRCDAGDDDADGDGVADTIDTDPTNPNICRDVDADTCDDCTFTGANGSAGSVSNDGPDNDGDGICNNGDPDDDNDGAPDDADSDDNNPLVCSDNDADTCNDCSTGTFSTLNDGPDADGDGICDATDNDDDGNGFEDGIRVAGGGCSTSSSNGSALNLVGIAMVLGMLARRRRQARRAAAAAASLGLGAVAASVGTANAQVAEKQNFSVERFSVSQDRNGILSVESGLLGKKYSWDMHLWLGAANDPLNVYNDTAGDHERVGSLVQNRIGGELGGSVVLLPWLQVAADLPLIFDQSRDTMQTGITGMLSDIGGVGLGDLRISPKGQLLKRRNFGLALTVELTVPTASAENYRGEAGATVFPYLSASSRVGKVRWALNLGYLARSPKQVADLKVDDELRARAGVSYAITKQLEADLNASLATAANDPFGSFGRNYSEVLLGPAYTMASKWVLFAAAGAGLQAGFGSPDWRALAGVRIGRFGQDGGDNLDPDGDGVLGAADQCPTVAEDRDGFKDADGCPDLDNDEDQIADAADKCPSDAEDRDGFEDDDGCPDPDNDKDGIADATDKCPSEAETVNGFQDDDGCADLADRDNDRISDATDKCPDEPEDADGVEDGDGCPEDNDKDGVADNTDKCPLVAGAVANAGCPDLDRDNDTVVDRLDTCPDEAGDPALGGCKRKQSATITSTGIQIVDVVYFQTDKAIILAKSFKLLDNVAAVIAAHPDLPTIVIEGHTDDRGDDAHNLDLSQRRAEAVKTYLAQHGIAAERLAAKGFGETQPLASNKTNQGRSTNRRVEFKIAGVESLRTGPSDTLDKTK